MAQEDDISTSFLAANSYSDLVMLHDRTGIVPLTPCKKNNVVSNPSLGFRNRIQKKKMCSMIFLDPHQTDLEHIHFNV